MEGHHTNDAGLYEGIISNLFYALDQRKNEFAQSSQQNAEMSDISFTYGVKIKFVEMKDEIIVDLLQKYNYNKQPTQVVRF